MTMICGSWLPLIIRVKNCEESFKRSFIFPIWGGIRISEVQQSYDIGHVEAEKRNGVVRVDMRLAFCLTSTRRQHLHHWILRWAVRTKGRTPLNARSFPGRQSKTDYINSSYHLFVWSKLICSRVTLPRHVSGGVWMLIENQSLRTSPTNSGVLVW